MSGLTCWKVLSGIEQNTSLFTCSPLLIDLNPMRLVHPGLSRDSKTTFLSALSLPPFFPSFHKYLLGPGDAMVLGTMATQTISSMSYLHLPCLSTSQTPLRLTDTHSPKLALTASLSLPALGSLSPLKPSQSLYRCPFWHLSLSTSDYSYLCTWLIFLPDREAARAVESVDFGAM